MSVLGIDIGTSYCVLATIGRGAVSIVRNDLSERLTPALVSFTDKERLIGEAAHSQIRSNFRNTARNIKQLLGVTKSNLQSFEEESQYSLATLDFEEGGLAGYKVQYKGVERIFTATRCMAALLTKLRDIGEKSIGGPVHDVVISVPAWFSEQQRQAMLDAAHIAGLNCLRAMNEHAAVALDYGINRSHSFDAQKPSRVAFVGVGHGAANVFITDFVKGELRMLAVSSVKTIGGRNFDNAIIQHFASQFNQKYKLNPLKNAKALLKLEDAATKAKKILSANIEAPFNIECLMEDYDLNGILTRTEFEELCAPYQQKLADLLGSTFDQNGISPDTVEHVEIIGGCVRIPWIQEVIKTFFNNRLPLSKTLSMDETVARGCALQAAMLNPRYRVREYAVIDRSFEPVSVSWHTTPSDGSAPEVKSNILFERGSELGINKWLTFMRQRGFELRLSAGEKGQPLISVVEPPVNVDLESSSPKKFKVKARLSLDGIASWEAAQLLIDEEVEETVKEKRPIAKKETASPAPVPGDADQSMTSADMPTTTAGVTEAEFEEVEVIKKKIKTKRFDCTIRSAPREGYLEPSQRKALREDELAMALDDQQQQQAKEMMNSLESYIYNMRNKLQQTLSDFATQTDKEKLLSALTAAEDWIYENPEGSADLYVNKLTELKTLSDPIEVRLNEFNNRKGELVRLSQTLSDLRVRTSSPQWSHIEMSKIQNLQTKINETEHWMRQIETQMNAIPLHSDSFIKSSELNAQNEMLVNFAKTILIPKPAAEPVASGRAEDTDTKDAAMEDEGTGPSSTMSDPPETDAPMN